MPDYVYPDLERKLSLTMHGGPWCIFLDENNDEQSYGYNVTNDTYGCNDYIYHDGKIDTKMIFHAIRDALAHSLYEVIDKDYIRIYGYDEKNNVSALGTGCCYASVCTVRERYMVPEYIGYGTEPFA